MTTNRSTVEAVITVTAQSWTEARYDEPAGESAFAQADFTTTYTGDLEGTSACRLLIAYTSGDPGQPETLEGDYVGLERVTGTLHGRTGGFALAVRGVHRGGTAHSTMSVVPGSGTGELVGLSGQGESVAGAMSYPLTLRYEL